MKKHLTLIALLCCANAHLQGALAPKNTHLEITPHHLTRITFQRGLGLFIFKREAEGADVFKNNVTRSVTQATKKLFEALIKKADINTIIRHLKSGADTKASLTFEHQGTTVLVTPDLIIAALEHPASREIFQAFASADSQITAGIHQLASNEPEIGDLFKKVMAQLPHSHEIALPLTPPESPQETKALFSTAHDLTQQELRISLLSLQI